MEQLSLQSVTTQAEVNFVLNGIKQELPLEYRQHLPACAVCFGPGDEPLLEQLSCQVVKIFRVIILDDFFFCFVFKQRTFSFHLVLVLQRRCETSWRRSREEGGPRAPLEEVPRGAGEGEASAPAEKHARTPRGEEILV